MQKKFILVLKRALKAPMKLIKKLYGRNHQPKQQSCERVQRDPCILRENHIRCAKRPKVPTESSVPVMSSVPRVPAMSSVPNVPMESSNVPVKSSNVPVKSSNVTVESSIAQVIIKPIVIIKSSVRQVVTPSATASVSERVEFYIKLGQQPKKLHRPIKHVSPAIQEIVARIEALKRTTPERPQKRMSEKIGAMVRIIEGISKKPAIALPEAEELALDEFFSWAMVPMLRLDDFFAWAQVPVLDLDVFFAKAEIKRLQVDEFFTETDDDEEESQVKVEQVKTVPRSCSFDTLQITTRGSPHSHSCPELFMLMA